MRAGEDQNLVQVVRRRAVEQAQARAFLFLKEGEEEGTEYSYGELDRRARAVAAVLQAELGGPERARGERVLLMHPPGLEQIVDLLGCLYAGTVPVPTTPPRANRSMLRAQGQAEDSGAALVLTVSGALEERERLVRNAPALEGLRWLAGDALPLDAASAWRAQDLAPGDLALLQYTSGSTGTPKGVAVSHGSLLYNEELVRVAYGNHPDSVIVSWLPLHHDMGLMGMVLQTLYVGCSSVMMSPPHFVERPARWLEVTSRHRGTMICAPDFAFDLVARRITPEELARLDLSSIEIAVDGSEPVRLATLERFARTFAPAGFRRETLRPAYGLAEATLLVSIDQRPGSFDLRWIDEREHAAGRYVPAEPEAPGARPLIGCGTTLPGQEIAIVDPERLEVLPEGQVGEIWVRGPSVASGFWRRPEESERTFRARPRGSPHAYLRTGDLGFLDGGELFVSARLKDVVIVQGQNHYPQDLEQAAERSHPGLRPSASAAFAVELDGRERAVLVAEVERAGLRQADEILAAIRGALAETSEVALGAITLIRPSSLPRTSSGKVQRRGTRAAWLAGELAVVAEWRAPAEEELGRMAEAEAAPAERTPAALEGWLRRLVAAVLGVGPDSVDPELPLARLGLDSLRAVQLSHRVERELGRPIPLARLYEGKTLAELARELSSAALAAPTSPPAAAGPAPLSQGQRSLWLLQRLDPEDAAYNLASAARVRSGLDAAALERAFERLVLRHAALRTTLEADADGEPRARVRPRTGTALETVEAAAWGEAELGEHLGRLARRPFDLARGPLVRLTRLARGERGDVLLLAAHHVALDHWSLALVLADLARLYRMELEGSAAELEPAPDPQSFARAQAAWLAGPAGEAAWKFWRAELAEAPEPLELCLDRPRTADGRRVGRTLRRVLGLDLSRRVAAFARGRGLTPYLVAQTAFEAWLARESGRSRFDFGTLSSGRGSREHAELVGYLVNPLVQRSELGGLASFEQALERARARAARCLGQGDFPFPVLVERLRPAREADRTPLFRALFVWQHAHATQGVDLGALALGLGGARLELGPLELESIELAPGTAQFDLSLVLAEVGAAEGEPRLGLALEYDARLFEESTARRWIEHYLCLFEAALRAPGAPLCELPLAPPAELAAALAPWTGPAPAVAPGESVHALLAARAREAPDATAVVCGERRMGYGELLARVEGLAALLVEGGLGPEDVAAVLAPRSLERCLALLAVNVAGAAWMSLDPAWPPARRSALLADARARVVLVTPELAGELEGPHRVLDEAALAPGTGPFRPRAVPPAAAAYVMHTSGSTGSPKGVVVPHGALLAHAASMASVFGLSRADVVLHLGVLGFDIFVEELYPTLLGGARLVVHPGASPPAVDELDELIEAEGVTLLDLSSAYWNAWAGAHLERGTPPPPSLRLVMSGGERASAPLLASWRALAGPRVRWFNSYGPTETTVTATVHEPDPSSLDPALPVPIGRAVPLWSAGVLDAAGQPATFGVPGELVIGGPGVARGYLGRPRQTAEAFVPDPRSPEPGARVYRSGDRARLRADGALEFLGRADEQVKVRGFRVEPAEAGAELARVAGVREAVVAARADEGGATILVGYFSGSAEPAQVEAELARRLPHYLVPARLVRLESLPRTATGKLDRRALPAPAARAAGSGDAPQGAAEELLARLMAELIGVATLRRGDDFFELGGDSIRSIQLAARAARAGWRLSPADVFRHPRPMDLARVARPAAEPLASGPRAGPVPLSPIQRWFLTQNSPEPQRYDQHALLESAAPVAAADLRRALSELARRHDALRLVFEPREGSWAARIAEPDAILPVVEVATEPEFAGAAARTRRSFDLSRGPLLKAVLEEPAPGRPQRLWLGAHHLVIDAVSWPLLVDELEELLEAAEAGRAFPEPAPAVPWGAYARWIEERARAAVGPAEGAALPATARGLVADGAGLEADERVLGGRLDPARTARLLEAARDGHGTVEELLVTALAMALREAGGRAEVRLELEGHGRGDPRDPEPGAPDLARSVGWFTELLPLAVDLAPARTAAEGLRATRDALRAARRTGRAAWRARFGLEGGSALAAPRAEVSFNYLGQLLGPSDHGRLRLVELGRERSPQNPRSHALELDAHLEAGELRLAWSHPAAAAQRVAGLARRFEACLDELLGGLAGAGEVPRGADFALADLDAESLERVLSQLDPHAGGGGGAR